MGEGVLSRTSLWIYGRPVNAAAACFRCNETSIKGFCVSENVYYKHRFNTLFNFYDIVMCLLSKKFVIELCLLCVYPVIQSRQIYFVTRKHISDKDVIMAFDRKNVNLRKRVWIYRFPFIIFMIKWSFFNFLQANAGRLKAKGGRVVWVYCSRLLQTSTSSYSLHSVLHLESVLRTGVHIPKGELQSLHLYIIAYLS